MQDFLFTTPTVDSIKFEKKSGVLENKEVGVDIKIKKSNIIPLDDNRYSYGVMIEIGGEQTPINMSLQISCLFKLENTKQGEAEKTIEEDGTKVLISYARPIISDIISRSGVPPFDLPYIER